MGKPTREEAKELRRMSWQERKEARHKRRRMRKHARLDKKKKRSKEACRGTIDEEIE